MGFVRWCWVKGSPNQVFDSRGKRDYSKYRQRCISPLLPRRLIWSVQKIFPEICQRREDWERSINYPGIESSATRYIMVWVFGMKYEIWNEFETFTQVYEALLLLVQKEVICSKRKISAIILVLDIAATMVGGTRIYWGDQKRLHWSKFTWFLGFLLSGVSETGARTTIWYKTDNLGSFKEMTNVHQGWKEKGEVVTFWEGRKWRGNGDRPSDFHRMKTGVDSTIEPRFLGTYLTEKLFPHYTCHASATAQSN